MPSGTIDLKLIVDSGPINAYRYGVLFLLLLAMFVDGYDILAMSYAAPLLTQAWHLNKGAMGTVFSVGWIGLIVGGAIMGVLGDWIGRRKPLIISMFFLVVGSLGTAFAANMPELMLWRFLAGLSLGAIVPLCTVMVVEYAPENVRATAMACMLVGLGGGGAAVGGWISTKLVPTHGWQALFFVGAAMPLLVGLCLVFYLPESIRYLFTKDAESPQLAGIAARLAPAAPIGPQTRFAWTGEARSDRRVPYRLLVSDGLFLLTVVLCIAAFCGQMTSVGLVIWLPTLLQGYGLSAGQVAFGMVLATVGGFVGGVLISRLVDTFGISVLAIMPLIAIPIMLAIGLNDSKGFWFFFAVAAAGFSVTGGMQGLAAILGFFYPTAIRSSGVGLVIFISRFGAVVSPLVIGALLSRGARLPTIFLDCIVPLFVMVLMIFAVSHLFRARVPQSS
jgi:AAHS family 4-hydroxybenzoate transporter-like MFS transporter